MTVPVVPFRVKICGVTSVADAEMIADSGADAIGLNFYEPSPRSIKLKIASEIADAVRDRVRLVGVFVNHSVSEVANVADQIGLDVIQLHGDETADFLTSLQGRKIVRAVRARDADPSQVDQELATWLDSNDPPVSILIDAYQADAFGGTGKTVDWNMVRKRAGNLGRRPLILAGGLNSTNIGKGILTAEPDAVDTASGVETAAGQKSPDKVRAFVAEATLAFDELNRSK